MAQLDRREILMAGKSSTYDGSCGAHVRMLYLELYTQQHLYVLSSPSRKGDPNNEQTNNCCSFLAAFGCENSEVQVGPFGCGEF